MSSYFRKTKLNPIVHKKCRGRSFAKCIFAVLEHTSLYQQTVTIQFQILQTVMNFLRSNPLVHKIGHIVGP